MVETYLVDIVGYIPPKKAKLEIKLLFITSPAFLFFFPFKHSQKNPVVLETKSYSSKSVNYVHTFNLALRARQCLHSLLIDVFTAKVFFKMIWNNKLHQILTFIQCYIRIHINAVINKESNFWS